MTPEELQQLFTERLRDHVVSAQVAWGQVTVTLDAEGYLRAAHLCRDDPGLACDFFDCIIGVDEREQGFSVVANLYSTTRRHRVLLRHECAGGREKPVAPSLADLYRGANWHERETWDMFGIDFDGHPGLAPRILCTENFEGWPLRKDFPLATREAKPWPGAKEPAEHGTEEQREEALVSTVTSAGIKGDEEPDAREEAAAKAERARQKAAEMRRRKAEERAAAEAQGAEPRVVPAPGPEVSAASDPRVATPEQRSAEAAGVQDLGGARQRAEEGAGTGGGPQSQEEPAPGAFGPSERDPGEETSRERTQRAVQESLEAHAERAIGEYDQTSVPGQHTAGIGDAGPSGGAYLGGSPAPPAGPVHPREEGTTPRPGEEPKDVLPTEGHQPRPPGEAQPIRGLQPVPPDNVIGTPPSTQEPGIAPVDGGIYETAEQEADAAALRSGARPDSTAAPQVEPPPQVPEEAPTALDLGTPDAEPEPLGPSGPQPTQPRRPSPPPAPDPEDERP